jgi:hypothetical protein
MDIRLLMFLALLILIPMPVSALCMGGLIPDCVIGASICGEDGHIIYMCTDDNSDGCLEYERVINDCPLGCYDQGDGTAACRSEPAECINPCSIGEMKCDLYGDYYKTCVDDGSGCGVWDPEWKTCKYGCIEESGQGRCGLNPIYDTGFEYEEKWYTYFHLKYDEECTANSYSIAIDSSEHNNTLSTSLHTGCPVSDSRYGKGSLNASGADLYLDIPSLPTSGTFGTWFKYYDTDSPPALPRNIVNFGGTDLISYDHAGLYLNIINNTHLAYFQVSYDYSSDTYYLGLDETITVPIMSSNDWHYVEISWSSENSLARFSYDNGIVYGEYDYKPHDIYNSSGLLLVGDGWPESGEIFYMDDTWFESEFRDLNINFQHKCDSLGEKRCAGSNGVEYVMSCQDYDNDGIREWEIYSDMCDYGCNPESLKCNSNSLIDDRQCTTPLAWRCVGPFVNKYNGMLFEREVQVFREQCVLDSLTNSYQWSTQRYFAPFGCNPLNGDLLPGFSECTSGESRCCGDSVNTYNPDGSEERAFSNICYCSDHDGDGNWQFTTINSTPCPNGCTFDDSPATGLKTASCKNEYSEIVAARNAVSLIGNNLEVLLPTMFMRFAFVLILSAVFALGALHFTGGSKTAGGLSAITIFTIGIGSMWVPQILVMGLIGFFAFVIFRHFIGGDNSD